MSAITNIRYAVVYKGRNTAKYGASAPQEAYINSWNEVIQEDVDEWDQDRWDRFYKDQEEEHTSCLAEIAKI